MNIRMLLYSALAIMLASFSVYGRTVSDVVDVYGEQSRARITPFFEKNAIAYPPEKIAFLAMKDTNLLEVWAPNEDAWHKIKVYDIKAASGKSGPKLREGDRQVPEGIYKIIGLNPNSSYHLSMKLNYPNEFDLKWAKKENRTEPGTNIFMHGKSVSIGCLAMGDEAIEELFILVNDVGTKNVNVIITPTDPRKHKLVLPQGASPWVTELYANINTAFSPYKLKTLHDYWLDFTRFVRCSLGITCKEQ